jgi:hypothetical protein
MKERPDEVPAATPNKKKPGVLGAPGLISQS